ncbi:MAG: thioredoxin family protein [Marinomonas sp.]
MYASIKGFNPDYSENPPTIDDISQLTGDAILEFGAPWCGYCQASRAIVAEVLGDLSIPHVKVFDGKGKKLGRMFGVKLWPTLILLRNGTEVNRIVRPKSKEEIDRFLAL